MIDTYIMYHKPHMHGLYGKVRMLVFAAALTCGCVEVGGGAAASRNVSSAPLSRSKITIPILLYHRVRVLSHASS